VGGPNHILGGGGKKKKKEKNFYFLEKFWGGHGTNDPYGVSGPDVEIVFVSFKNYVTIEFRRSTAEGTCGGSPWGLNTPTIY